MRPLTVVIPYSPEPFFEKTLLPLTQSALIDQIMVVSQEPVHLKTDRCRFLSAGPLASQETLSMILGRVQTKFLLLFPEARQISIEPKGLERIQAAAESTKAGMVYSDFYVADGHDRTLHPLNDYQLGSVRDDFDFGAMILFSAPALREAVEKYGIISGVKSAGLYDLRLKVSIDHPVYHLKEPLYRVIRNDPQCGPPSGERIFRYVDPLHGAFQKEMEVVFTDYLKKIKAYLPHSRLGLFAEGRLTSKSFPAEASVVIPVRNRKETIAEAAKSALSQETDFPFNILVVDNHSTDGTTDVLSDLARQHANLNHIIPKRTDLGIGGCWNEALHAEDCGRCAVQLDSDDLYSSGETLQKMVDMLRKGNYAMVIGSYTLVNSELKEVPPGLIDHREWTEENGHNNGLRVNGLGAPRAFNAALMREIEFLNVSYGEDYAAGLRISREYKIGRIYEGLYLCRRWPGNTDSALSIEESNRNDAFKDKIRTDEILARQEVNRRVEEETY